ncbi:PP2C family protein-serine/threonine phosphatase [Streptacidiphilus fuscans]|uniref:Serine/threonine-protein phosphatase n=1 Tax=Streptacidiphilus fuscans TaxID=2789292 RepID=A0A931B1R9_9ACTN|nr:PP2C family protein-serine/threonine phosphatase [Streptacidiphilus fuscans]MBF9067612.1 serine/threonine-protein phosphatase [Streptacidiphilus fuscans]
MTVAGRFRLHSRWGRAILLLPFVGVILVFILDRASNNPDVTFEPALTAGPALAAVVSNSLWFPLAVGAVTVGEAFGIAAEDRTLSQSVHTASVLAIILISAIGATSVLLRNRQERALADARLVSEVAQRILLRSIPERIGPVRAAVHYAAAAAHARIGGDLYEVVQTRYGVRAVIGDVRGKGLAAVETAAAILGAFREAAHQEQALDRVASWLADSLGRALHENGDEHEGSEEEFVTLVLIGVRADSVVEIVNCGHPAPLLLRRGAPVRFLDPPANVPPLGVLEPEDVAPPILQLPLQAEDRLLLYTDGVIEARNSWGVFYPLAERVPDCASSDVPSEVLDRIHEDVRRHVGHQLGDDAAMLLLQYAPVPMAGAPVASRSVVHPRVVNDQATPQG